MLTIKHLASTGRSTLILNGELGIDYVYYFREQIEYAETYEPKEIVLDFNALEFLDSTGVKALIEFLKSAEQKKQKSLLVNIKEHVYVVLDLIGVVEMFGKERFHQSGNRFLSI